MLQFEITGDIWYWRGPAPFHFVTVEEPEAEIINEVADIVSYGWGMIPVSGRVGRTTFTTALWPREGLYVIPLKDATHHG